MRITYSVNEEQHDLDVAEEEDLAVMAQQIEAQLRAKHPELQARPDLPVKVADGLLNSLADDGEEVVLGDITEDSGS